MAAATTAATRAKTTWTIAMTKFLITEYENNECLYNSKHQDYKNRTKRSEVFRNIARQIHETFEVECTEEELKKKINGLRTQYQAEKLKIIKSIKSGADADSIYTPTVYWFPLLKFLDISLTADESISNLDEELSSENYSLSESSSEPRPSSSQSSHVFTRKRRTTNNIDDTLLHQATRTMQEMSEIARKREKQDNFDTFGSFVASELRSMSLFSNERFALMVKMKLQKFLLEAWEEIEREPIHPQTPATSPAHQSSIETRVTTSPQRSQHYSQLTLGTSDTLQTGQNMTDTPDTLQTRQEITDTPETLQTGQDITDNTEEQTYSYIINENILTQALTNAGVSEWDIIQLQVHNNEEQG